MTQRKDSTVGGMYSYSTVKRGQTFDGIASSVEEHLGRSQAATRPARRYNLSHTTYI